MIGRILGFGGVALLSGCGTLVTSTLLEVGALDPFTADPGGFTIGMDTDSGLSLIEGSVTWTFEATHSPSGEKLTLIASLEEERRQDGMVLYRLSDADASRLRQWQTDLVPWKETSDGNSSLSFFVTGEGCRLPGIDLPADPTIAIFVRLADDAPLRPLARAIPVTEYFAVEDLNGLPDCENRPF